MHALLAQCQAWFGGQQPLLLALFLGGLVGSMTHCIGMCGPLVAAQAACRSAQCGKLSEWSRVQSAGLLSYHAGRITTYAALGAVSAWMMHHVMVLAEWKALASIMLLVAGIAFLMSALAGTGVSLPVLTKWQPFVSKRARKVDGLRGYALGVLLGFMPCGLLFAALMAASASGSAPVGAVGMMLFGLGTVPALFVAGWGAGLLARRFKREMVNVGRLAMAANGVLLCVMAGNGIR